MSAEIVVFDIETDGFDATKVHCTAVSALDGPATGLAGFERTMSVLDGAKTLIAHNGVGFDGPVLDRLYPGHNFSGKILDTLILSRLIFPEMAVTDKQKGWVPKKLTGKHSLEAWGHRLGCHKGDYEGGWEEYSPEMLSYCIQDVEVTRKLYLYLKRACVLRYPGLKLGKAIELEHQVARICKVQEKRGFGFDEEGAVKLLVELTARKSELHEELTADFKGFEEEMKTPKYWVAEEEDGAAILSAPTKRELCLELRKIEVKPSSVVFVRGPNKIKITPFNPGSRDHVAALLKLRHKWRPTEWTTPTDLSKRKPKVDAEILGRLPYPEAKLLTEYYKIHNLLGQLSEGPSAWLRLVKDGRLHGAVLTQQAVTGRASHARPNIAQVPRVGNFKGEECRDLFLPTPGYKLVGMDAAGLELRCLAHYLHNWDDGEYTQALLDGDIHTFNQEAAGLKTRDMAKTFIYGWLYGAGDAKIGKIVEGSREAGRELKEKFLTRLPAVRTLRDSCIASASVGYIRGIDGRPLLIRSSHAALNTLLQGAGAIICKHWLTNLDRLIQEHHLDAHQVAWVHDELQFDCWPGHTKQLGELGELAIKQAEKDLGLRCPLTIGDASVGMTWKETH